MTRLRARRFARTAPVLLARWAPIRRLVSLGWSAPVSIATATVATAVVGIGTVGALGAFTATVGENGTITSGSIVLRENGSSANCYSAGVSSGAILGGNSYVCTSLDVFGAPINQLVGTSPNTQTLTFTNVGSANASTFTVTPGTCSAAGVGSYFGNDSSNFCGLVDVTIGNGAAVCYFPDQASACPPPSSSDTLNDLQAAGPVSIGSGLQASAADTVVVTTLLDGAASGVDMGLEATQGFTWTLGQ